MYERFVKPLTFAVVSLTVWRIIILKTFFGSRGNPSPSNSVETDSPKLSETPIQTNINTTKTNINKNTQQNVVSNSNTQTTTKTENNEVKKANVETKKADTTPASNSNLSEIDNNLHDATYNIGENDDFANSLVAEFKKLWYSEDESKTAVISILRLVVIEKTDEYNTEEEKKEVEFKWDSSNNKKMIWELKKLFIRLKKCKWEWNTPFNKISDWIIATQELVNENWYEKVSIRYIIKYLLAASEDNDEMKDMTMAEFCSIGANYLIKLLNN